MTGTRCRAAEDKHPITRQQPDNGCYK